MILISGSHTALADTGREGGGGDSVTTPSGEEIFLDIFSETENEYIKIIQIEDNALTRNAYIIVNTILTQLTDRYNTFGAQLRKSRSRKKWKMSLIALADINDSFYHLPYKLNQAAIQDQEGVVTLSHKYVNKVVMDDRNRAALILHEILLYHLGIMVDRKILRSIVSTLISQSDDRFSKLEKHMELLSPSILVGKLEVSIVSGLQSGAIDIYRTTDGFIRQPMACLKESSPQQFRSMPLNYLNILLRAKHHCDLFVFNYGEAVMSKTILSQIGTSDTIFYIFVNGILRYELNTALERSVLRLKNIVFGSHINKWQTYDSVYFWKE